MPWDCVNCHSLEVNWENKYLKSVNKAMCLHVNHCWSVYSPPCLSFHLNWHCFILTTFTISLTAQWYTHPHTIIGYCGNLELCKMLVCHLVIWQVLSLLYVSLWWTKIYPYSKISHQYYYEAFVYDCSLQLRLISAGYQYVLFQSMG